MDTEHTDRRWGLIAAAAVTAAWAVGSYLPPVSNTWVTLNLLVPAGQPHLAALPFAYPAVGIDGHTLCSLLGIVILIAAAARWISYLERYTPAPPAEPVTQPTQPPAPAAAPTAAPVRGPTEN